MNPSPPLHRRRFLAQSAALAAGLFLTNRTRNRGLRGPDETPDQVAIDGITAANRELAEWASKS